MWLPLLVLILFLPCSFLLQTLPDLLLPLFPSLLLLLFSLSFLLHFLSFFLFFPSSFSLFPIFLISHTRSLFPPALVSLLFSLLLSHSLSLSTPVISTRTTADLSTFPSPVFHFLSLALARSPLFILSTPLFPLLFYFYFFIYIFTFYP